MQRQFWAAVLAAAALAGASACASADSSPQAPEPAWLEQQARTAGSGYPSLHDVPRTHMSNTDQSHWDAVRADVVAAGQAMKANPRAAVGPPAEDPNAFLADAQEDLEQTRDSH